MAIEIKSYLHVSYMLLVQLHLGLLKQIQTSCVKFPVLWLLCVCRKNWVVSTLTEVFRF